jgi:diaminopimelate epimerase
MDYRNADGSIVEMCGNGVRVVAKYVVDRGLVAPDADGVVLVATRAGVKPVTVERVDGQVVAATVDMGPPVLEAAQVPFVADGDAPEHEVQVNGAAVTLSVVSMGNPHAVLRADDVDAAPVTELGPLLEHHERFPARVNVGFAEPVDDATIRLRVWERGVGETAACGTGACAAVVALQGLGMVGETVDVRLPGGTLQVRHAPGGTVWMTGPAVEVASGELDAAWLATVGEDS